MDVVHQIFDYFNHPIASILLKVVMVCFVWKVFKRKYAAVPANSKASSRIFPKSSNNTNFSHNMHDCVVIQEFCLIIMFTFAY